MLCPRRPTALLRACHHRPSSPRRPLSGHSLTRSPFLVTSDEVSSALSDPVSASRLVALESTIITHGLPYPLNLETARACEDAIRDAGGIPATVALFDGKAHVGLSQTELQRLAEPPSEENARRIKASRRDLAAVLADPKAVGGTTVSGTMLLSSLLGIRIFATGGIGGVHRGGHASLDVSADLTELGRTNVSVFCSGAKSILDIPRTLEYLETQGVDVLSFDPEGAFPAFYTRDSGCKVRGLRQGEVEAARIIQASHTLGLGSGRVFGVPIPTSFESAGAAIQEAVEQAVRESVEQGIDKRGKEVTPWLLMRVGQLAPKAGESNRALVVNNAATAARTAVELSKIVEQDAGDEGKRYGGASLTSPSREPYRTLAHSVTRLPSIIVFGTAAADITSQASIPTGDGHDAVGKASTYPGRVWLAPGGVGRNMAEAASRLLRGLGGKERQVRLVAPTGNDTLGAWLRSSCEDIGLDAPRLDGSSSTSKGLATATASLSLDAAGDLITGVVDMSITESLLSPEVIQEEMRSLRGEDGSASTSIVAFDANLSTESMEALLSSPAKAGPIVAFEPTSLAKSTRILDALASHLGLEGHDRATPDVVAAARRKHASLPRILCTPNEIEIRHMASYAHRLGLDQVLREVGPEMAEAERELLSASKGWGVRCDVETLRDAIFLTTLLGPQMVKMGSRGVLACLIRPHPTDAMSALHFTHHAVPAPLSAHDIVSTTGAGDTFVGSLLACLAQVGRENARAMLGLATDADLRRQEGRLHRVLEIAQLASARTLRSEWAVAPSLDELGAEVARDGAL